MEGEGKEVCNISRNLQVEESEKSSNLQSFYNFLPQLTSQETK